VKAFKKKDIKILIITKVIRNFYFGYLGFILLLYLRYVGFSYVEIGSYALVATVSSSILFIISGFLEIYMEEKKCVNGSL
jgi:hypothetical protein